jgi:hypothetical protein
MTEHIEALEELRRRTVEQRRKIVKDLAAPKEHGGAQDLREMLIRIQTTLEAVDRALEDERRLAGGGIPVSKLNASNDV